MSTLAANFEEVQRRAAPASLLAVVKANAYGHGLARVGKQLAAAGAEYFGVSSLEEGLLMRRAGIKYPILTLSPALVINLPIYIRAGISITVYSMDQLLIVEDLARRIGIRASIHLRIDTGLGDTAIPVREAHDLILTSANCAHCSVEGIYSHFATNTNIAQMHLQLEKFQSVLQTYDQHCIPRPMRHMANSAGLLLVPEASLDMVRVGLLLYGLYPAGIAERPLAVRPALTVKSRVVHVREVSANDAVGYGSTWKAERQGKVAVIPIGYADGYPRRASNGGFAVIKGKPYRIIGTIAMNQSFIFVGTDEVREGDEAVVLGGEGERETSFERLSEICGLAKTELLCGINPMLLRRYQR